MTLRPGSWHFWHLLNSTTFRLGAAVSSIAISPSSIVTDDSSERVGRIALVVANEPGALGALVLARSREFGMLRHVGMTRRQIGAMCPALTIVASCCTGSRTTITSVTNRSS